MEPRDKFLTGLCVLIALLFLPTSCTDAERAKMAAFGNEAHVICMSGGKVLYEGGTSGKMLETKNSDGFNFVDKATGKLVQVTGDCAIRYK